MSVKTRGFASLTPAQRRAVASTGGTAAHVKGVAYHWTSELAHAASLKGLARRKERKLAREQELEAAKLAVADMIAEGAPDHV